MRRSLRQGCARCQAGQMRHKLEGYKSLAFKLDAPTDALTTSALPAAIAVVPIARQRHRVECREVLGELPGERLRAGLRRRARLLPRHGARSLMRGCDTPGCNPASRLARGAERRRMTARLGPWGRRRRPERRPGCPCGPATRLGIGRPLVGFLFADPLVALAGGLLTRRPGAPMLCLADTWRARAPGISGAPGGGAVGRARIAKAGGEADGPEPQAAKRRSSSTVISSRSCSGRGFVPAGAGGGRRYL